MNSRTYFDNIAKAWGQMRSSYFKDELKDLILKEVNVKDKIACDLGCGTGFVALSLLEGGANIVFAIDQSTKMLGILKDEAIKREYKNIYPLKSSLTNLSLFNDSVDIVTINMALHHVVNPQRAIQEIYRILKPGGRIVISDVYEHDGEWARREMFDIWLGFNEYDILRWLEKAKFKDIEIKDTGLTAKASSTIGEYTETGIFISTAYK